MTDTERWQRVARAAGLKLEGWYMLHPRILRSLAPALPTIIDAFKKASLDHMEKLLGLDEFKPEKPKAPGLTP